MALNDFSTYFSPTYQEVFSKVLIGKKIANTRFQSNLKFGDTVTRFSYDISGVQVRDIVNGVDRTVDAVTDSEQNLVINFYKGTTFNLPNLTDKTTVHKSPTKAFASSAGANAVAASGTATVSLAPTTLTSSQIAAHTHGGSAPDGGRNMLGDGDAAGIPPTGIQGVSMGNAGGGGAHSHSVSGNFSGDSYSTLQPYLTVIYIIKT